MTSTMLWPRTFGQGPLTKDIYLQVARNSILGTRILANIMHRQDGDIKLNVFCKLDS